METYTDTWGKFVKLIIMKKYVNSSESLFTQNPEFENIEYAFVKVPDEKDEIQVSEEYHLDGLNEEVKASYLYIKNELIKKNKNILFNPQKYYISIKIKKNILFFRFSKKTLKIVVLKPVDFVEKKIKNNQIRYLSNGVQKFWGGHSCEIIMKDQKNIDEVISLLKEII